jgi:hypothetical protein
MTTTTLRRPRRPSRRRLIFFALLWIVIVGLVALASPGCYGRNCEAGLQTFGTDPGQGRMIDENTWESSPQEGEWIPYPKQVFLSINIPGLNGRTPQIVLPYISAAPNPRKTGSTQTLGGGNLALIVNVSPNHVDLINDSCSDYYLRLVVVASPFPSGDASVATPTTDSDAGTNSGDASGAAADTGADSEGGP